VTPQSYLLLIIAIEALLLAMLIPPSFYVMALGVSFVFMDMAYLSVAGLNLKLYNILTVCLTASLVYRYFSDNHRLPQLHHVKTSVLFLASISLSILVSEFPTFSLRIVSLEVLAIVLFWGVSVALETREQLSLAIRLWLWVSNAMALLEILDIILGVAGLPRLFQVKHADMFSLGRPTGWFAEPDRAAQYHMLVALWTLPIFMVGRDLPAKDRLTSPTLIRISFLLNIIIVILGVGRSAWLGFMLGAGATFVAFYRKQLIKMTKVAAVSIMVLALVSILSLDFAFRHFLHERLEQTFREMVVAEFAQDPALEKSSIALMTFAFLRGLDKPWIGHGLGTYPNYYLTRYLFNTATIPLTSYERSTQYETTWNRYAQLFFGAGLLGLITYLIWQFDIINALLKSNVPFPYRIAFLAAIVGMFWGHDQFRAVIGYAPIYWLIGLSVAMQRLYPSD
jgi:hypothetical protein